MDHAIAVSYDLAVSYRACDSFLQTKREVIIVSEEGSYLLNPLVQYMAKTNLGKLNNALHMKTKDPLKLLAMRGKVGYGSHIGHDKGLTMEQQW